MWHKAPRELSEPVWQLMRHNKLSNRPKIKMSGWRRGVFPLTRLLTPMTWRFVLCVVWFGVVWLTVHGTKWMTFTHSYCSNAQKSTQTEMTNLLLCVMSSSSLRRASCRFKVMVAESERFNCPGDILMHKHEFLLFSCAINSSSKQYVQYVICLSTHTHTDI